DDVKGVTKTWEAFKQVRELASKVGGILSPQPYTKIPETPDEAKKFVETAQRVLTQYRADLRTGINALAATGNAMQTSEDSLANQAALRRQIAELKGKLLNEEKIAKETLPPKFFPPKPGTLEYDAWKENEAKMAAQTLPHPGEEPVDWSKIPGPGVDF